MSFIDEFYAYFSAMGMSRFVRIFWFFVFFEGLRFIVIELITLLHWKYRKKQKKTERAKARGQLFAESPLVSVIVPGKNEGKHIYPLARSLKEQTYTNIEVIVVDDGSDDHTPDICRSLKKNGLIDLFIRNEVRGGKASAANTALRFAKGKYVVHLDADSSYNRDALENILIPFYLDPEIGGVGGNVMVRNYKDSLATTLQAIEYFDTISVGRIVTSHLGIYRIISGAFGAFRMDILHRLRGWDIGPGLDGDITVKIRKLGYKIAFAEDATCFTNAPDNFKRLTKQRLRWDKSIIRFRVRKHKDVFLPNRRFNLPNFISFTENITYSILLNVKWYFYLIDMVINYPSVLPFIIVMNFCLYTSTNFFKFIVFSLFRERRNSELAYFLPYIPLMVIYMGYYMRIVRTIAHFQEIFLRKSYDDPWNPPKTSRHAKALHI